MKYSNEINIQLSLNQKRLELLALRYNVIGTNHADDGKFLEALEYFSKAIELNPLNSAALFNRATIKADLGDLHGAKKDFALVREIETKQQSVIQQESGNINFF
jgi:tetratricopeptide (TPR) repeat protein